jgi:hypothetical protein
MCRNAAANVGCACLIIPLRNFLATAMNDRSQPLQRLSYEVSGTKDDVTSQGGVGTIELNRETQALTITYHDSPDAAGEITVTSSGVGVKAK